MNPFKRIQRLGHQLRHDWKGAVPPKAYRRLSRSLRAEGHTAAADEALALGRRLHPDSLLLVMEETTVRAESAPPAEAVALWENVLRLTWESPTLHTVLESVRAVRRTGDFPRAEEILRHGLTVHPGKARLLRAAAELAVAAGDHATGIHRFQRLIDARGDADAGLFLQLAEVLAGEGLHGRAGEILARGLAAHPGNDELQALADRLAADPAAPAPAATSAPIDFTAHLFSERAEPFGKGTISLPLEIGGANRHLPALLDFAHVVAPLHEPRQAATVDVFATWGATRGLQHNLAREMAARSGKPLLCLEYGFISSLGLAVNDSPQHSIIVCPEVIYFDTSQPSPIETALNAAGEILTPPQSARARACIDRLVAGRITKYNHAPQIDLRPRFADRPRVLLVDQRYGDRSVEQGLAGNGTFERMLEAALALAGHEILIKLHPDAISGGQRSYLGQLLPDPLPERVTVIDFDVNPFCLFEVVDKVFVCTSQLGFEAVLAGCEVHCFGVPFYAGWGFTVDRTLVPRRWRARTVEEIFHTYYIRHSRYFVPGRGVAEIEDLIDHLVAHRPAAGTVAAPPSEPAPPAALPERMRILIVLPSSRHGASARYIQTLAWSLCRLGCEVLVLAEGRSPRWDQGVGWLSLAFENGRLTPELREAIVAFAPHVVYENGVRSRAQRAALEALVLTGARFAMQSEDDDVQIYQLRHGADAAAAMTLLDKPAPSFEDLADFMGRVDWERFLAILLDPSHDRWIEPVMRALCYRLAGLHTAIWRPFAERLAAEYAVPTLVVPPVAGPADFQRIPLTAAERAAVLERHGIPADCIVFFVAGALYDYSSEYALFLEALNHACDLTAEKLALLVVSGRSSLPVERMAHQRLRPEIAFADAGKLPDDRYMELLKACDVVCSPGVPDDFNRYRLPSRLVKAMAMGKPVLLGRHGFGDSLVHLENAFLTDGSDPRQWAGVIAAACDRDRLAAVGAAGNAFARAEFDSGHVAAALFGKFQDLLRTPPPELHRRFPRESEPAGTLRQRTAIRVRSRQNSSMQQAINLISPQVNRLDAVVHVGAGRCREFVDYCRLGARHVTLVEAREELAAGLESLRNFAGGVRILHAAAAPEGGTTAFHLVESRTGDPEIEDESSLLPPAALLDRLRGLRHAGEITVPAMALSEILAGVPATAGNDLLVLETQGAEARLLASVPAAALRRFRWIATRVSAEPLFAGAASAEEISQLLAAAGFRRLDSPADFSELLEPVVFQQHPDPS